MAEAILVNSAQNASPNAIQVFYTSSNKTYKAYIYDASATALTAVIPQKIVVRNRFDLGPSIVGQLIPPGGTLRMESSAAASIAFRVTGNEL